MLTVIIVGAQQIVVAKWLGQLHLGIKGWLSIWKEPESPKFSASIYIICN